MNAPTISPPPIEVPGTVFIGIGHRCEVAWQIRRYFAQEVAYPFDWLVTPLQSVPAMVRTDFADLDDEEALEQVVYGDHIGETIWHRGYDVFLHHDFPREGSKIVPGWRATLPAVKAKWNHVRERWRLHRQSV